MFRSQNPLKLVLLVIVLASLLAVPILASAQDSDIVDTAVAAGDFETLVAAVQAADLVDALKGDGPFTVFAPTDAAFAALPDGTVESLLEDKEALSNILLYHVVAGKVMAADVKDGMTAETLQGSTVTFSVSDDGVKINDANIVTTDIETSNGVIHVIDAVILPPAPVAEPVATAAPAASTTTIAGNGFIGIPDGATVKGTVEVQAVADDPDFMKWQLDVLPFQNADQAIFLAVGEEAASSPTVIATIDTTAFPNGEHDLRLRVVRSDSNYDEYFATINIDNQGAQPAADTTSAPDIVDTAVAAGDFGTLVAAVQAAGLVDALKGDGPFTVFAPTDAAFAALPDGTVEALLEDTAALSNILLYHVVSGEVMAADVKDGMTAETLQGSTVSFSVSDAGVKINDANIVTTDIKTSNGVIHVIDAVILPPADAPVASAPAADMSDANAANGFVGIPDGASVSGTVEVQAVANDPDFMKWQLDVLPFQSADQAIFLAVGEEAASSPTVIATIDTTLFPNGEHDLRLRVVRSDSNYDEYYVTINIDN
jgi:transforming growth factor-beta-induced protein